jgi:hypothetical protein
VILVPVPPGVKTNCPSIRVKSSASGPTISVIDVCPGAGFVDAHDGIRDASPTAELEYAGLADGACPVAAIAAADPSDRRDGSVPPPKHDWDIHLDDAAEGLLWSNRDGAGLFYLNAH